MSDAPTQSPLAANTPHPLGPRESFEFGSRGGNMLPAHVTIDNAGKVTSSGNVHVLIPNLTLSQDARDGLLALAVAEHFFSLPDRIGGIGNPDVASRFITIQRTATPSGPTEVKTVESHQTRNPAFDQ